MGTINIYKGIGNEYKTFRTGGTLKEALNALAPNLDINRCVFLNAGQSVDALYKIKDDDIIFVREVPGATVCAIIGVACAAIALGMSIYSAVENQKAKDEAEKAERESKALSQTPEASPFLKGAKNKNALGNNIPFVMGSIYLAPYKITNGYYSIGGTLGDTQYWSIALCAGYKNVLINNLSIGSKRIVGYNSYVDVPKLDGSKERVYYMAPSNKVESEDDKKFLFHSGMYSAESNTVQLSNVEPTNAMDALKYKVTSTSYGDEIPHKHGDTKIYKDGLVKELEQNTYRADICVMFNGLRYYDDGWKALEEEFEIYWSNSLDSDNPTWIKSGALSTGSVNTNQTCRFEYSLIFSASQCFGKNISVKIVRKTEQKEKSANDTAYLCYINSWQYDAVKSSASNIVPCTPIESPWSKRTLQIGLKILANDSTKDTLDEINCMAYGTARIWDGAKWTSREYPTRNPAAWILAVLTTDIHPHSKFLDSEIDMDALGELYEYCEKENFYCDGIVTQDTKKSDLLNQILTECNATMFMANDGKWTFAVEKKQDIPIALLNEQSVQSVTVAKSFARKAYAQKITFTDRTTWNINTTYINENNEVNPAEIYDKQRLITETTVKYITSGNQVLKYARRLLARQKLQPREITVNVGREGDYYPLYSKVLLQMKQLKIGLSGGTIHAITVQDGKITQIQTSDLCDFSDTSKSYGIIIQAVSDSGSEHIYAKVKGKGSTRNLTLVEPVSCKIMPLFGNIYSFGYLNENAEFSTITNPMTIYGAKQNLNGWELTLKDYNEALFEYGEIPEYKTNLTTKKEPSSKVPGVTYSDLQTAMTEAKAEVTNTIDINKYTLDISPEAQSVPVDASGKLVNSWFYISAYLYYLDRQLTDNITYKAYLPSGDQVGQWDGNKVKISSTFLKGDILYITIKATYKIDDSNIIERTLDAQISRLYGADSTKIFKMLFPDGEKVKIDNTGEVMEPEQLRVTKRVATGTVENNTDFGHITIETVPGGKESVYSAYQKVEEDEAFSEKKTYYHAAIPFVVKADEDKIIGDGSKSGALFFMETLK